MVLGGEGGSDQKKYEGGNARFLDLGGKQLCNNFLLKYVFCVFFLHVSDISIKNILK